MESLLELLEPYKQLKDQLGASGGLHVSRKTQLGAGRGAEAEMLRLCLLLVFVIMFVYFMHFFSVDIWMNNTYGLDNKL